MFTNDHKFRFFFNSKNVAFENPLSFLLFSVCLLITLAFTYSNAQGVAPIKKGNFWIYDFDYNHEAKINDIDSNFVIDSLSYYHIKWQSDPSSTGIDS